jgi:hypothetical protein
LTPAAEHPSLWQNFSRLLASTNYKLKTYA